MPSRHISPQSFDDILSELGDDPAIPDPHGIRKTPSPPKTDTRPQAKNPKPSFSAQAFNFGRLNFNQLLIFSGLFIICTGALIFYFDSTKSEAKEEISALQNQLASLKGDLDSSQSEWVRERDELYDLIDEIEVSIHSLDVRTPTPAPRNKPAAIPHETDLRRWRYLGITRMGSAEQAFFHTGKSTKMVRKEDVVLGEWRLTQAEKDQATATHPRGKSITFKSTQAE